MTKKHVSAILLVVGIILIAISLVLSVISTGNKNVIGGADLPTFTFVFFYENKGAYSLLAFCGIICLVSSLIIASRKR